MTVLERSLSGAIVIMVIIVIRALAINRLPKKTFLVLWGVALCRLLLPFCIPTPFSAYNLVPQGTEAMPIQHGNIMALITPMQSLPIGESTSDFTANSLSLLLLVWLLGMLLLTAYFALAYCLFRRELQMALPVQNMFVENWLRQQKMKRTIVIRQSSCILTPLTYGIVKPVILMPRDTCWENTAQITYILTHELVHIRRFDTVTKLLLTVALCIHWFNPLVWVMYLLANRDLEISCDEAVVRSFGVAARSAYAHTLIAMEEKKRRQMPLCNSFSKNAVEERITAIMKMKPLSTWGRVLAILLVVATTAVFATSAMLIKDEAADFQIAPQNARPLHALSGQQGVLYDTVEVRYYTDGAAPYVFWSRTNHTDQAIDAIQFTMLAFDASGQPLSLPWSVMDSSAGYSYDVLCQWQPVDLKPHSTADSNDGSEEGGWSLGWTMPNDDQELQALFAQVAYVLCCDKQITFANGAIWYNPDYQQWLETYAGRQADVSMLANYYVK